MSSHNPNDAHTHAAGIVVSINALPPGAFQQQPLGSYPAGTYYDPQNPYTYVYGAPEDIESFLRPLIFNSPLADRNPEQVAGADDDSTLGDHVSNRSVLVADSGYEWVHGYGRRYHGQVGDSTAVYHLPNGQCSHLITYKPSSDNTIDELELDRLDLQHAIFTQT
jgi:hypothetical protein